MSHCCLCGLLCSLDRPATADCLRRSQWLQQLAPPLAPVQSTAAAQLAAQINSIAALLHPSRRGLIWIDGADVQTLRCAVNLAASVRGTIHVGQSTGAAVSHRVLVSQGWLGSSLAEVASHADLIISLGSDLGKQAPLLAQRCFAPALADGRAQWCHIDSYLSTLQTGKPASTTAASTTRSSREPAPDWTTLWTRTEWYELLTHVMLGLQRDDPCAESAVARMPASVRALLSKLQRAKSTVWIWDVDEFRDDIDELCIQRLLGISRLLSQTARCSLIALDSQVGRVTAAEGLLWLTGCSGTAHFDGQQWRQPHAVSDLRLEEWSTVFDSVVVVRCLPSVYPLPNLSASHFVVSELSQLPDHITDDMVTRVGSIGVHSDGHVMRGDRATWAFCQATADGSQPTSKSWQLPTAANVLEQVLMRIQSEGAAHAN